MEGIVEEADDVADERRECLSECEMTGYTMSLQTVPYDTKPYEEFFRLYQFNMSKATIDMFNNPQ